MSNIRSGLTFAALCLLVGCAPASSSSDAGAADTGTTNMTPVDSGTPPTDAGPGPTDAGPTDAGPTDAGPTQMYGSLSCDGVVSCLNNLGLSTNNAITCDKLGTKDAGLDFYSLLTCVETETNCASPSEPDAGGCVNYAVSDAGACYSQFTTCQNQGLGCQSIFECIGQLEQSGTATETNVQNCLLIGTNTASNLGYNLFVGCVGTVCADAGTGAAACGEQAISDAGACWQPFAACLSDTSANP